MQPEPGMYVNLGNNQLFVSGNDTSKYDSVVGLYKSAIKRNFASRSYGLVATTLAMPIRCTSIISTTYSSSCGTIAGGFHGNIYWTTT